MLRVFALLSVCLPVDLAAIWIKFLSFHLANNVKALPRYRDAPHRFLRPVSQSISCCFVFSHWWFVYNRSIFHLAKNENEIQVDKRDNWRFPRKKNHPAKCDISCDWLTQSVGKAHLMVAWTYNYQLVFINWAFPIFFRRSLSSSLFFFRLYFSHSNMMWWGRNVLKCSTPKKNPRYMKKRKTQRTWCAKVQNQFVFVVVVL